MTATIIDHLTHIVSKGPSFEDQPKIYHQDCHNFGFDKMAQDITSWGCISVVIDDYLPISD